MKRFWITYFISVLALPSIAVLLGFPLGFIVATSLTGSISTIIGMSISESRLKLVQKILEAALVSSLCLVVLLLMSFGKHGDFEFGYIIRQNGLDVVVIFVLMTAGLLVREVAPKTKHQVALGLAAAIWSTTLFSYLASFYWNEGWWLD
jgi:hypothetical protein